MKKRGGGDEGGSWMDTYGDLVTLLMTFFVLLYSMSSIDSAKWDVFVRSIFPNGRPGDKSAEQIIINGQATDKDEPAGEIGDSGAPENTVDPNNINELYLQIAQALNAAGIDGVEVSRGQDYTFVVFKDKAFFAGDSSVITPQGQETLSIFCDTIAPDANKLSQVNIMGHTAQADPERANNPRNDRILSVMRAAEVCLFIQGRGIISPDKLVSIGYGQFHPIADNATSEGRAKNRRVEILLIDEGAEIRNINEYFEEYYSGANADKTIVTDGVPENIHAEEAGAAAPAEGAAAAEAANPAEGATPAGEGSPAAGADSAGAAEGAASTGSEAGGQQAMAKEKTPQVAGVSREIPGEKEENSIAGNIKKILGDFLKGLGGKAKS
ncbi:chemotaxis protein MotB [Oribacterium sinus]|uniref:Chemotaxis protein MotB n=1 Tax=Oribacterium sinus TaxID=237576 RepID=A0A7W9SEI7_9FIRM|nr:flagellar motor protein MotB [Oribacterium sinus]MBB6040674.1 chemotaxis protein MotB [Oribacterium sinus]